MEGNEDEDEMVSQRATALKRVRVVHIETTRLLA